MSAVLEMRDVLIALGRGARRQQVLDGIDLSVEPGRTVGLIGASGSGKTTVGRIALGLLRPDDGTVAVSGRMHSGTPGAWRGRSKRFCRTRSGPSTRAGPWDSRWRSRFRSSTAASGARTAGSSLHGSCPTWDSTTASSIAIRTSCRADSGRGRPSHGRSSRARSSSSSTRRCRRWTSSSSRRSSGSSALCRRSTGSPPCSSPTISPRPGASPTGSSSHPRRSDRRAGREPRTPQRAHPPLHTTTSGGPI